MYIQSGHRWLPSHFPYWFFVGCLETVSGCTYMGNTQSRNIWTCRRDIPNPSANFTQNWCYCKLSVLSIQIAMNISIDICYCYRFIHPERPTFSRNQSGARRKFVMDSMLCWSRSVMAYGTSSSNELSIHSKDSTGYGQQTVVLHRHFFT